MERDRGGVTLIELIVAIACALVVLQLTVEGLLRARVLSDEMRERSDRLVTLRTASSVLRRELRTGQAGRDWSVHAPDSVQLRAFRGTAWVCPDSVLTRALLVAWRGVRQPAPEKDSVLLLDGRGEWRSAELVSSRPTTERCSAAPGVEVRRWEVSPEPTESTVLARLFEAGSYHISGGALRYRRGDGGRQPLTAPVLRTPPSGLVHARGVVSLYLFAVGDDPDRGWDGYLVGDDGS